MRNARGQHYLKTNLISAFASVVTLVLISGLFGGFIAGTIPSQTHWLVGGLTFWIAVGMLIFGALVLIFFDGCLGLLVLLVEALIYMPIIWLNHGLFVWLKFIAIGFSAILLVALSDKKFRSRIKNIFKA